MNQVHVTTRSQWRQWLATNHDQVKDGVWLVFHRKNTGRPSLDYEESVEEALCFGWIDSIIKRIDDDRYCRKFTPRKDDSAWSNTNKQRVEKITREGRMTEFGQAKVNAAKGAGRWAIAPRPIINLDVPQELSEALDRNQTQGVSLRSWRRLTGSISSGGLSRPNGQRRGRSVSESLWPCLPGARNLGLNDAEPGRLHLTAARAFRSMLWYSSIIVCALHPPPRRR